MRLLTLAGRWLRSRGGDTRWLYPAITFAVALWLLIFRRHYTELDTLAGITSQRIFIAIAAGLGVFVLWINLNFERATFGKSLPFNPSSTDGSGLDMTLVWPRFIGLALVVPIMAELFWRPYLLRWIDQHDFLPHDPATGSLRAIVLSALLFASEHNCGLPG